METPRPSLTATTERRNEASAGAIGTDRGGSQVGPGATRMGGRGVLPLLRRRRRRKKGRDRATHDHDDPFIDDEEVVQYIQRSKAKTKRLGFS